MKTEIKSLLRNVLFPALYWREYGYRKIFIFKRPVIAGLPTGHVLVVAPHPDDDVLACGGLLAQMVDKDNVTVCFVTNGERGLSGFETNLAKETREGEAKTALKSLGITSTAFFRLKDGSVSLDADQLARSIRTLIVQADHILLPALEDMSSDHYHTTITVLKVLKAMKTKDFAAKTLWFYEVWSPNVANVLIDISSVVDQKLAAIRCHKSQLEAIDYDAKLIGLNAYRSITAYDKSVTHCEAYLKCTVAGGLRLAKMWTKSDE